MAVPGGEEKTYFRQWDGLGCSLEQTAAENLDHTRVYLNSVRDGNRIRLSLSKDAGDRLYIVSNRNHDDLRLYFAPQEAAPARGPEEKAAGPAEISVKRAKQQSLLSFFGKK